MAAGGGGGGYEQKEKIANLKGQEQIFLLNGCMICMIFQATIT